jgi:hypothetical protein
MKRSRGLWIWSLIVLFVQPIFAQDSLPTDAELHSAYCIPVLNYWVEFYSQLEKTAVADEKTAGNAELRQEALGYSEMMRDLVGTLQIGAQSIANVLAPACPVSHLDRPCSRNEAA